MVYRLSWIAAVAATGFALLRAERLLRPSVDGLPWQAIMIAAALLGGAITWAGVTYRLRTGSILLINLVAAGLVLIRIAVPDTTWFVFPTVESFSALGTEMAFRRRESRIVGHAPRLDLPLTVMFCEQICGGCAVGRRFKPQTDNGGLAVFGVTRNPDACVSLRVRILLREC